MTYHKTGYVQGAASQNTVLSPSQVIEIFLSEDKADYLAAKHGVNRATIYNIKKRKTWSHLTKDLTSHTDRVNKRPVVPTKATRTERK